MEERYLEEIEVKNKKMKAKMLQSFWKKYRDEKEKEPEIIEEEMSNENDIDILDQELKIVEVFYTLHAEPFTTTLKIQLRINPSKLGHEESSNSNTNIRIETIPDNDFKNKKNVSFCEADLKKEEIVC